MGAGPGGTAATRAIAGGVACANTSSGAVAMISPTTHRRHDSVRTRRASLRADTGRLSVEGASPVPVAGVWVGR